MNKNLEHLRELQEVDKRLRDIEKQRLRAPARVQDANASVEQGAQELESAMADAKEYQAHIEVYNLELKTQEEKRDRLRGQLNTIKTNKEYAALQQEIAGHEADMSRLEDKILEMMTEVDDQEEAQRKAEEKLEAAKAELQKAERETADELKRCDPEETALNGKREKIRSQIGKDYLDPYDRLLTRRDGVALVGAEGQVCQGCFISLPPQTRNSLMTSEKPVFCHSCGRMLYLKEET